ncbi:hypothetical protein PR003_g10696 [Phytophthora rubi]|uniref:Methyltransferase type 11 domain-containing protein n=1 Tax=Phytophthora rubi TaxID=129364 RepID=A0A6A3NZ09_9STRA|nr:hypothetical protein PR001_g1968 [Phytophthora rubi]KAE9340086.1 hypothetical protein PR003_g10696 [Phytophthora rubi]
MADVTAAGAAAPSCSPLTATELEREHVHKVYDLIAPHFSHTRHHPWPQVTQFLAQLEPAALVADVGCGNGKYLRVNPSLCIIGADRSIPLMQTAASHDCNLLGCDALKVPLRTGAFDAALSIAVMHHISTEERRVALLSELARLVRVGGEVLIVAWAFEQDERSKRRFEQQDVMVEWKLQQKYTQEKDSGGEADSGSGSHGRVDRAKRWWSTSDTVMCIVRENWRRWWRKYPAFKWCLSSTVGRTGASALLALRLSHILSYGVFFYFE